MPHSPRLKSKNKQSKSEHKVLDIFVYFASLVGPVFTIPQIYIIFISKSAENVSLATWTGYLVVALIWTWYGIVKKDGPIIFSNGLWAIAELIVLIGAIIYK